MCLLLKIGSNFPIFQWFWRIEIPYEASNGNLSIFLLAGIATFVEFQLERIPVCVEHKDPFQCASWCDTAQTHAIELKFTTNVVCKHTSTHNETPYGNPVFDSFACVTPFYSIIQRVCRCMCVHTATVMCVQLFMCTHVNINKLAGLCSCVVSIRFGSFWIAVHTIRYQSTWNGLYGIHPFVSETPNE